MKDAFAVILFIWYVIIGVVISTGILLLGFLVIGTVYSLFNNIFYQLTVIFLFAPVIGSITLFLLGEFINVYVKGFKILERIV